MRLNTHGEKKVGGVRTQLVNVERTEGPEDDHPPVVRVRQQGGADALHCRLLPVLHALDRRYLYILNSTPDS